MSIASRNFTVFPFETSLAIVFSTTYNKWHLSVIWDIDLTVSHYINASQLSDPISRRTAFGRSHLYLKKKFEVRWWPLLILQAFRDLNLFSFKAWKWNKRFPDLHAHTLHLASLGILFARLGKVSASKLELI